MADRFPKKWLLYYLAKSLFLRFGVITLIFFAPLFTLFAFDSPYAHSREFMIAFGSWFLLIAPFAVNYFIAKKRKQRILSVLEEIKTTGYFNPDKNSEGWSFWTSTYIGFDHHKGTMVYIRVFPGKVMDVIGFDAYSLTRTETEGGKLSLYTKLTTMPLIPLEVGSSSAKSIEATIHAMNNKGYNYNFNFPNIVQNKRKKLETLAGMPIPELI
ncbi:plasmid IncI1-type surface exclusion protein ExcA [Pectobacterium aroidearum]|uniref:plasmid IncI1-type surface exclusion protein ExcA n=1 Tax=Pectobacterium aroidearum TaxID=1201031 RepID=UPI0031597E2A